MDVLEKLNRRFTDAYEKLFKGPGEGELRPRDVLRRSVLAMEDARREGLDGQSYVPNVYTIGLALATEEQRELARAFLDADELAQALAEKIGQHGYKTRGPLQVVIEELPAGEGAERVRISTRWEAGPVTAPPDSDKSAPREPDPNPRRERPPMSELPTAPLAPSPLGEPLGFLQVAHTDGRTEEVALTADGLRIGRKKLHESDLLLGGDGMVSKKHAHLRWEGGRFVLYDEGSTNGTYIDGERLVTGRGMPLSEGDEVLIGQTRLRLQLPQELHTIPSPFAVPKARELAPSVWAGDLSDSYRLVSDSGESFVLASRMLLGRALTDDIVLVGEGVGPQHARITVREGMVRIEDLESRAGTVVNGERIPAHLPVALSPGDTIALGQVRLRLQSGQAKTA